MSIIIVIIVAALAIFLIAVFSKTPTCSDRVQNQGEAGVDCGGPCAYLCTADERAPTVLFTQAIVTDGRVDIVASVENKNATAAAKNVPYTVTIYGTGKTVVQKVKGAIDLLPSATTLVYVPGVASGVERNAKAFLEIDPSAPRWFTLTHDPRVKPVVSNTIVSGTTSAPRIDAVLTNPGVTDLPNVRVIIFVHDAEGDVMAASQTIMPDIPAQGDATATFTWNSAFPSVPANIEVVPIIPLP